VGGNFRLDALQAAILRAKLPHLESWNEARRAAAATYRRLFAEAELPEGAVVLPREVSSRHVYHQFVIRARDREGLRAWLADRKIETMVYYPRALHRQPCFAEVGRGAGSLPVSESLAESVLALPMYPELTASQQATVVDAVAAFYGTPRRRQ
jgi:dTDP-4-amino-4,6-dideoxygalactose transaminase